MATRTEPTLRLTVVDGDRPLAPRGEVPLRQVEADVRIDDVVARIDLVHRFRNDERVAVEALYVFPVEVGSALRSFEVELAGRRLRGEVATKDDAFRRYDDALAVGHGAFLLEQESPDVMSISLGRLEPGEEATVRIGLDRELPVVDRVIRFTLPTTIGPRYAPASADPVRADRLSPPIAASVPYRLSLRIRLPRAATREVRGLSHPVTTRVDGDDLLVVPAAGLLPLDRDVVLEVETAAQQAVARIGRHASGDEALVLRIFPEVPEEIADRPPVDLVFLLDCSGSMDGSSLEAAKRALGLCLRQLSVGDRFSIVRFGSTTAPWRSEPLPYGANTLAAALEWLEGVDADLGGTELMGALGVALDLPLADSLRRDVVLLTDGHVTDPEAIVAFAANHRSRPRVFTLGVGCGPSSALVDDLSRATGGSGERVLPGEAIEPAVLRQFARMGQPPFEILSIAADGFETELPDRFPPMFGDDSATLWAVVRRAAPTGGSCTIAARCDGRDITIRVPVPPPVDDDTIPRLCALDRIRHPRAAARGSRQPGRPPRPHRSDPEAIALRFGLLSEWTSLVVVEERADPATGEPVEFRRVPIRLLADWGGSGTGPWRNAGWPSALSSPTRSHRMSFLVNSSRDRVPSSVADPRADGFLFLASAGFRHRHPDQDPNDGAAAPWYLALLATQTADGDFDGLAVAAARLGRPVAELELLGASLTDDGDRPRSLRLFSTLLAIRLLEDDPEAREASRRAITKARRWIRTKGQPTAEDQARLDEAVRQLWEGVGVG